MPTVATAQTLKNSDGSASEMFYGVDSPKYVRINENKNLEQELADIHQQVNDLSSNINQRITKLDTDLKAEIKSVDDSLSQDIIDLNAAKDRISTLEGEIFTLIGAIEDLNTRLAALENPEANV